MVITEAYIRNFGKFSEQHFYFHDGVQVVTGENEYGKTTIHAFIRAMLFGMERGRGRAAAKDDYTRYEPWDHPEYYAGVLRFSCGGRNFRLERNFSRAGRRSSLVCEDDGEELSVEHGDLKMLLGGLTPEIFDSTVSVGQLKSRPGEELSEALENYAAGYFEAGGGEIDPGAALETLKNRRKDAEKALRAEEAKREEGRRALLQECSYLEREMESLQSEFEEKQRALEMTVRAEQEARKTRQERQEQSDSQQKEEDRDSRGTALWGAAGIFAGVMGFCWSQVITGQGEMPYLPMAVISVIIILIGVGILLSALAAGVKNRGKQDRNFSKAQKDGEGVVSTEARRQAEWELKRIRAEWKEKEIRLQNLREQYGEAEKSDTQKNLERRCRVLALAAQELEKAARETGSDTVRLVGRKASEIFAGVTEGKYSGLELKSAAGGGREIAVWDGERKIPARLLSRGTIEQIYFAVRMAAADLLLEEPMPVILDDTFAFYDDRRLESALKWLSSRKKQVIIFTCQRREEEILSKKEAFS